jgi:hypothetical protein
MKKIGFMILFCAGCPTGPSWSVPPSSGECTAEASSSGASPRAGAATGASCQSASDCAQVSCGCPGGTFYAAGCINHRCDVTSNACSCAAASGANVCTANPPVVNTPVASAPSPAHHSSCSGESESHQDGPRGGAADGAPCNDSLDCAEKTCDCGDGGPTFYASACIDGQCSRADACACVAQQYQSVFNRNICT